MSERKSPEQIEEQIFNFLRKPSKIPKTIQRMAREINSSITTITKRLNSLIDKGLVKKVRINKKTSIFEIK